MKKNGKTIIGLLIAFIIGISTTVTAATVFNSKDITYSSDKTTKTNVKEALDELYSKANKCPEGKYCYTTPKPISVVNIGDYLSMTPTSTSYTLPNNISGCDGTEKTCIQNSINPSELNLWRVIRKNEDGTIEAVSEYVSSVQVSFYGNTGFKNVVAGLNTIAAQYTNEKYVSKTRHMGYSNQIEKCTGTLVGVCPSDTGYETDTDLVQMAIGTLAADVKENKRRWYWLPSRYRRNSGALSILRINTEGNIDTARIVVDQDGVENSNYNCAVRPIIILKDNISIVSGDGKSADTAYQLS